MLSFIFNQYDITFPEGGLAKSGFGVRRQRAFVFEEADIVSLRTVPRRRGFVIAPLMPVDAGIRRRGFRFPQIHFGRSSSKRRGFDADSVLTVADAGLRLRGFSDDRVLIDKKPPSARGFEGSL